jgi:predicted RNase H-like HicB family nuclease
MNLEHYYFSASAPPQFLTTIGRRLCLSSFASKQFSPQKGTSSTNSFLSFLCLLWLYLRHRLGTAAARPRLHPMIDTFLEPTDNPQRRLSMILTAVYLEVPEGYIGFVEELPGANTQGNTLDEARENLQEAVKLVMETNRELAEESLHGQRVIRERFALA